MERGKISKNKSIDDTPKNKKYNSSYNAKFHYIAELLYPDYEQNGYVYFENKYEKTRWNTKIKDYIEKNEIHVGDLLFIGSTYETRQEYGFILILENNKYIGSEDMFFNIPKHKDILKRNNIKYKNLIEDFLDRKEEFIPSIFIGDWRVDESIKEIIDEYKTAGIWDDEHSFVLQDSAPSVLKQIDTDNSNKMITEYYENHDGKHNKFWEITYENKPGSLEVHFTTRWGSLGGKGPKEKKKEFIKSWDNIQRLIQTKKKKQYFLK